MVSVRGLTEQIFRQYDYSRDGYIYAGNGDAWDESQRYSQKLQKGRYTDTLITSKHIHHNLMNFADQNKDKFVSKHELFNVLQAFDYNQDGKISTRKGKYSISEMGQFEKMYPETKSVVDRKVIYRQSQNPYNPNPWSNPRKPSWLARLFGFGNSTGRVPYGQGRSFVNRHVVPSSPYSY